MKSKLLFSKLTNGGEVIDSILKGISQKEALFKPNTDTWSALEVLCHLYDEEREDFREHLDLVLHRPTEKWIRIDPAGWVDERKYNEQNFSDMLMRFKEERIKSLDWLNNLVSPDWGYIFKAPFGPIKAGDLLASWVMHDNLHIRQLIEIRYELIFNQSKPYSGLYAGEW